MSEQPTNETDERGPHDGGLVRHDTLTDRPPSDAAPLPLATDAHGIDRIVGIPQRGFEPAKTEASERDKRRAEERLAYEAAQRNAGKEALVDTNRVGETAQPLVDAQAALHAEQDAAAETTTATEVSADGTPVSPAPGQQFPGYGPGGNA